MSSASMKFNHVLQVIEKHLVPDTEAKKERGEVFTPPDLIREMLFGLQKSKINENYIYGVNKTTGEFYKGDSSDKLGGIPDEIWQSDESTFLDPACGIGNFPIIAFYKLDYELQKNKKWEKNHDARRKHIIEKMLFMIELNKGNVATCKKIFKMIHSEAKPNICCHDSLSIESEDMTEIFGRNKFSVIMGNPPFNAGGTKGEGKLIWPLFVDKYLDYLTEKEEDKPGGHFIFVNPPNWRNFQTEKGLKSSLFEKIKSKDLKIFRILNTNALHIHFKGIQQPMDYYMIENKKYSGSTIIIDIYNKISKRDVTTDIIIPNYGYTVFDKMVNFESNRLKFENKAFNINTEAGKKFMNETQTNIFKYPILKSIRQNECSIVYSNKPHDFQTDKKVLISDDANLYPTYDDSHGTSQHVFSMKVESSEQGHKLVNLLNSKLYNYVNNSLKVIGRGIGLKSINLLPDLTDKRINDDKDLYDIFQLTEDEIKDIEENALIKTDFKTEVRTTRKCKKQIKKKRMTQRASRK